MFVPTPHPVYQLPTREQYESNPERWTGYIAVREEKIRAEEEDPLRFGYEPESWALARKMIKEGCRELLIMGGNRAAKTEFAAKFVQEVLGSKENAEAWCCQTTEKNSIDMQQPYLWKYMPPEYTRLKKGQITNISFSKKNGFSNGSFIYPQGSRCVFKNYAQDPKVIEGGECDVIWCDELVPLNWIQTLRYRLATRGGLLLITFTAIEGWSPTVKEYLQGATTVLQRSAKLLGPKATVPLLQQPVRKNSKVVYFHTEDNPFSGYENLVKTLEGAPKEEILTRAYGVATRSMVSRFPKFHERVHVVQPENVPAAGTNYQFIDPASARNWFMIWVRVDVRGRHWVYREWPAEDTVIPGEGEVGAWAEPCGKKHDGKQGPAQQSFGWGVKKYVSEVSRVEGAPQGQVDDTRNESNEPESVTGDREEVLQRWMDSRFAYSPTQRNDVTITVLEQCIEAGLDVSPAPYDLIDEGVQLINNLLDYDKNKEVGFENEPHLYISSECKGVIFALKEWTGADGKEGACKDPIDTLRYMAMAQLVDIEGIPPVTGVRSY